jgi:serine/threonine-protein kinase HipA
MITTAAYVDYKNNPPAIAFRGRKTWAPGKQLQQFITATFGVSVKDQKIIIDRIGDALIEVGFQVRAAMREHPGFNDIGKRMLLAWQEGIASLRDKRVYAMGEAEWGEAFRGLSAPEPVKPEKVVIGRSGLLAKK